MGFLIKIEVVIGVVVEVVKCKAIFPHDIGQGYLVSWVFFINFLPPFFHYVYHIGQADSSDRVLSVTSDQDVQFDDEFYKALCNTYGAGLRERVFFFVDNRKEGSVRRELH